MTQIIFFDVDGVLIHGYNARPELRVCWDEHMEEDLGVSRRTFSEEFIFKSFTTDVLTGARGLHDAVETFLTAQGYDLPAQTLIDYWMKNDAKVNHELLQVVQRLSEVEDVRLYVATNQEHVRARYLMDIVGFSKYFEDIFYAARLGVTKPDLLFYSRIDELIGPYDNPPIFFDDSRAVVDAANVYGWTAYEFYDVDSLKQSPFISACVDASM